MQGMAAKGCAMLHCGMLVLDAYAKLHGALFSLLPRDSGTAACVMCLLCCRPTSTAPATHDGQSNSRTASAGYPAAAMQSADIRQEPVRGYASNVTHQAVHPPQQSLQEDEESAEEGELEAGEIEEDSSYAANGWHEHADRWGSRFFGLAPDCLTACSNLCNSQCSHQCSCICFGCNHSPESLFS